jgi:peptide/nickel transport system permease protein
MDTYRRIARRPLGLIGSAMLLVVVLAAIFAPLIAPYDPNAKRTMRPQDILAPPSAAHWLGQDDAGKDVLTQLIYGARVSLTVGFVSAFMAMGIGTLVGLVSGYYGGRIGNLLMRVVDFLLVIPDLPLMMVVIAVWGRGLWKVILVIGILGWTYSARLVRSQVLSIKERQFVLRAKSMGAESWRIILYHIFPQALPLIIAQTVLHISGAILYESTLAFLGLGDPLHASWGLMLNFAFARGLSSRAWWFLLPPGLAIVWVSVALILIGDTVEEVFNPRLHTHHLFDPRRMVALVSARRPPLDTAIAAKTDNHNLAE